MFRMHKPSFLLLHSKVEKELTETWTPRSAKMAKVISMHITIVVVVAAVVVVVVVVAAAAAAVVVAVAVHSHAHKSVAAVALRLFYFLPPLFAG